MAARSREAAADLDWLMAQPPADRRRFYRRLDGNGARAFTGEVTDQLGTPWGCFVDDPVGFYEVALGETMYDQQVTIAESVRDNERTAVPSGHSLGKTHLAARLILWFVFVFPVGTARVLVTSHSWSQLERELWAHVRQAHAQARLPGDCQATALKLGDPAQAVAYCKSPKDNDEQAFGGIHAPHVLTVVDEAGGMHSTTGQALEALMTGVHARQLLIGNPPADASGSPWFEERCSRPTYNVMRLSVLESPNYTGVPTPTCRVHPGMPAHSVGSHLVSSTWADDVARDVGTDHPYYVARVLAEFPTDLAGKVIPRGYVDAAIEHVPDDPGTWIRLGVDPASGGGDELAIARCEGATVRVVYADRMSPTVGAHDVAGRVLAQIEEAEVLRRNLGEPRRVRVKVENDGGIGWSVSTILQAWRKEGRHDAEVVPITVGSSPESAKGKERFANKRGEMWWNARDLLAPQQVEGPDGQLVAGPPRVHLDIDEQTARQLSAPNIEYHSSGRNLVESKESMRKRGVSSPDRADAVLLALYEPKPAGPASVSRYRGRLPDTGSGWN